MAQYDDLIKASAEKWGVPYEKLLAQVDTENAKRDPNAVSGAGAVGIGQIMPKWWMGKYDLNTLEDFKDPAKSINAMAGIMAQHVKQYGSWDAALVVYNAGQGKNNKYINAFNSGDYKSLPQETQDYLRKQGFDLGQAGSRPLPGVLGLSEAAPEVRGDLGMGSNGWASPAQGSGDALVDGLRTSPIGTMLRRSDPLASARGDVQKLSAGSLDLIRGADIGEAGVKFVMRQATDDKSVPELIKLAQENRKAAGTERTMLGDLSYGLGEMAGDPLTYGAVFIPGGAYAKPAQLFSRSLAQMGSTAFRLGAEGALTNVATEAMREESTGTDADFASAIAAGAAFGVGVGAVTGGIKKSLGKAVHKAEAQQTTDFLNRGGTQMDNPTILTPMEIDNLTGIQWKTERGPSGETPKVTERATKMTPIEGIDDSMWKRTIGDLAISGEGDVLHKGSGVSFTASNPMNPLYDQQAKDVFGKKFPTFLDIGDVLGKSSDSEIRDLFWNLGRNTRGYVDGSNGKFGATAQDVKKAMDGRFVDYQLELQRLRDAVNADPSWAQSGITGTRRTNLINERIDAAIRTGDASALTPPEVKLMERRREFYREMQEIQQAPGARWGVDAKPILEKFRENYVPIVYDRAKIREASLRFGGNEKLQDMLGKAFHASYLSDKAIRKAVDEAIAKSDKPKRTPAQFARDTAYGIVHDGKGADGPSSAALSRFMEGQTKGIPSESGFRKARTEFGHDTLIDTPDGNTFKVSDLFSHDIDMIDHAYAARTTGDVATTVGTGLDLPAFAAKVNGILDRTGKGSGLQADGTALQQFINGIYGRGVSSPHARWNAGEQILKNVAFMKSSTYMGVLNYTEIAAGIREHGLSWAASTIPGIGRAFDNLRLGKQTAETKRLAQNIVWGPELDRAIHGTFTELQERNVDRLVNEHADTLMTRALGRVQGATQFAADRWWTAQFLRSSTRNIVESARGEFFADMAHGAHGTKGTGFLSAKRANQASVSAEQLEGIKSLLRETTSVATDGTLTIKNADKLANDPRANDLRRYGQYWSERVIQQNTPSNASRLQGMPVVSLATQFMSFVQRSVNAKLVRGANNVMHGDIGEAIDMLVLAPLLGGLGYAGITYLQSGKYADEADRKQFLRERLGGQGEYGAIVANSLKRTSAGSGPGWLYDFIGQTGVGQAVAPDFFQFAGMGKTSIDANLKREKMQQGGPLGKTIGDAVAQAPAVKLVDNLLGVALAPVDKAVTPSAQFDEIRWMKTMKQNVRGLLPNDPLTQRAFQQWLSDPF